MHAKRRGWSIASMMLAVAFSVPALQAAAVNVEAARGRTAGQERVAALARVGDYAALREMGPGVMETLVLIYPGAVEEQRAQVAGAFYFLGWKSEAAKRLLLADVHTPNEQLRLRAQWALGRVSDSPEVVQVLLDNMMQDPNPLFRDKAACALAYDQIHISDVQKVRLFAGLIQALDDPKPQVARAGIG